MLEDARKVELLKDRLGRIWDLIEELHHIPFNTSSWADSMMALLETEEDIIKLIKLYER
jgi:hypothetical protein